MVRLSIGYVKPREDILSTLEVVRHSIWALVILMTRIRELYSWFSGSDMNSTTELKNQLENQKDT